MIINKIEVTETGYQMLTSNSIIVQAQNIETLFARAAKARLINN